MEKIRIGKGQVLHRKGDEVKTLEIVLAGALAMTDGNDINIRLGSGSMAGTAYLPGETYSFDYVALEDATLMAMDYMNPDDIVEAITGTPAIAPVIAAANMELATAILESLTATTDAAISLCKELKYNYNEYKFMCVQLGTAPEQFEFVEHLIPLESSRLDSSWEADLCRAYCSQRSALDKGYYPLDVSFCVETVMRASTVSRKFSQELLSVLTFIDQTKSGAASFIEAFYNVKSRVDTNNRGDSNTTSHIQNALDMILAFSGVDQETIDTFRKDVKAYTDTEDRLEKSDEMRHLRRSLSDGFYKIYEAAFFKSLNTDHLPIEVRMFFLFGFVDETLAGTANTEILYQTAVGWENDPEERIVSLYDWLLKIYRGQALPSKNEFDNDWFEYLREEVRTGSISQAESDSLQNDTQAMVSFEIRNMVTIANKATYGRLATFVPIFNAQDVVRPLEKCLASPARIREAFTKVTDIDYSCFYRPTLVNFPEFKIPHFIYDVEVKPYIILMPNIGSRGLMWQEIEGVRRTTPAHMMISIYHSEDLDNTVVQMCAQFRWEMCRRIQGVRYADVSEPSLTSEYTNYLQFYRKNGYLSADIKERIKMSLQKARNDYKVIFMNDYEKYIQNEAFGMPRLNKIAREILFKYCTYSQKFREERGTNPQYAPLMDRWNVAHNSRVHNVDLVLRKVQRMNPDAVPQEILDEVKYLKL